MIASPTHIGVLFIFVLAMATVLPGCVDGQTDRRGNETQRDAQSEAQAMSENAGDKIVKTDAQWKAILAPEQYHILREKGTERAFTGKYWNTHTKGVYRCAGCGQRLFSSGTKFDSGCGWPSFYAPADEKVVDTRTDRSLGMVRTEVLCSKCGGHLGHIFKDGPADKTGLRYCINSAAIELKKEAQDSK